LAWLENRKSGLSSQHPNGHLNEVNVLIDIMTSTNSKQLINLLKGWPSKSLLPAAAVRTAANTVFSHPETSDPALLYGPDWGYEPLRDALASWLTNFYKPKDDISPSRLCISGGASQNLACILQVYTDPLYTRNVWMVSPTYFLACRIFEDSGFYQKLRSIPEDEEGIDIEYLRREIRKSEDKAVRDGNTSPVWLSSFHLIVVPGSRLSIFFILSRPSKN
jgi:DNA-binding transcriptional MocR family regulator